MGPVNAVAPGVCTSSFEGGTVDLALLLNQVEGERGILSPGEDHSQPHVPAKLEAWPSGNSF